MKTFLKRTLSCLMVFACLLVCVAVKQIVNAETLSYEFDFTKIDGFSGWGSAYTSHQIKMKAEEGRNVEFNFTSANKQSTTITDCPVSKKGDLIINLNSDDRAAGYSITEVSIKFKQWTTKKPTIAVLASVDGSSYITLRSAATLTYTNNAATLTFSNELKDQEYKYIKVSNTSNNQLGWAGVNLTIYKDDNAVFDYQEQIKNLKTLSSLNLGYTFEKNGQEENTITLSYASENSVNVTDDAASLLNAGTYFAITSNKNSTNNFAGLNKDGEIRLYSSEDGKGTDLVITANNTYCGEISKIVVDFTTETYNKGYSLTVDDVEIEGTVSIEDATVVTFEVNNINQFKIQNVNEAASTQVRIASIEVTFNKYNFDAQIKDSSASLRFGTSIDKALYQSLLDNAPVDSEVSFGVKLAKVADLAGSDFVNELDNSEIVKDVQCTPVLVDADGNESNEGVAYQFAAVVTNIPNISCTDEIIAVCYVKVADVYYYYQYTSSYSVKTILAQYVELAGTSGYESLNKDLLNALLGSIN